MLITKVYKNCVEAGLRCCLKGIRHIGKSRIGNYALYSSTSSIYMPTSSNNDTSKTSKTDFITAVQNELNRVKNGISLFVSLYCNWASLWSKSIFYINYIYYFNMFYFVLFI